jgi:integrase
MRASEVQALRHRDVNLTWVDGDIVSGEVIVPRSKTAAGTGRVIPLTRRVCACLNLWFSRFSETASESFIFPFHKVGIGGNCRAVEVYDVDLTRPMGSWRKAWLGACEIAGIRYRWHDLRHTFVSRLAETASVSEQTIRSLAGHVSRQMLEHYSHIRSHAKQAAIRCLDEQTGASFLIETGHKTGHNSQRASKQQHLTY